MVGFIMLTFLRLNNVGMVQRRDAVHAADEAGDTEALQRRLYDLQRYVSTHMNTDPGRVDLTKTYLRDNEALQKRYAEVTTTNPNGDIFVAAQAVCDPIGATQGWRWPDLRYTNCITQELEKYPAAEDLLVEFRPLPTEPYYHSFASPLWSPDFAGWSVVVFILVSLGIIFRLVTLVGLNIALKYRYRKA